MVAYLADFSHARGWDPGTVSCRPARAAAPITKGAEWVNVSTFRGRRTELRYRLASPLLRGEFERLGDGVVHRMPRALDRRFGSGWDAGG
ncbi:hypothetical protein [Streptomyces sp. NPDC059371]|uniref:hypothetical protein n=1 Tax=Streptomyces sp. NPDC059371 TaxID=3346812 RepID=UPI00368AAC1A